MCGLRSRFGAPESRKKPGAISKTAFPFLSRDVDSVPRPGEPALGEIDPMAVGRLFPAAPPAA